MTKHYKETRFGVEEFHMKEFIITVFIICNILHFYYHLYLKYI